MKRIYFIGLIVMILFCIIGFTQNEFITEVDTAVNFQIDTGMAVDLIICDAASFEIDEEGILQNAAPVTLINNDGSFPNPFNTILGRRNEHAISTGRIGTQNYKEEFTFSYKTYKNYDTLRINTTTGITIGADNLKYPTYSVIVV